MKYLLLFLDKEYPLAMKMMFNFHAESNAQAILKSMQKETIVAHEIIADLPKSSDIKITPHPNIVKMYTAFSDYIPSLSESMELYPHALPPRINPQGIDYDYIFTVGIVNDAMFSMHMPRINNQHRVSI
jgi:hypothetical protein